MKRLFEIDWPESYGEHYVTRDLVESYMTSVFHSCECPFVVTDVTPEKKAVRSCGGHDCG